MVLSLTGVTVLSAQPSVIGDIQAPGPKFNIDKFEDNLQEALFRQTTGYSYAISQSGRLQRSGARGFARTAVDTAPNGVLQSAAKRMNIASISKPITAAAVHRVIQEKLASGYPNLNLNSTIGAFLPSSWQRGPGVNALTFAELLSQYTGMNDNGGSTSTAALKSWIATGVTRPKNQYKYINANLAIFRIILPYMVVAPAVRLQLNGLAQDDPDQFSLTCGNMYKIIVRQQILQPMGILNADMVNVDPNPTLLYNSSAPQLKGVLNGDWTETGAGGGWYLSAIEIARFLSFLRYDDDILTPATRKRMNDLSKCPGPECRMLGWQRPYSGEYGFYYYHSGSLTYGDDDDIKRGMRGVAMNFPNNTEAVVLCNSIGTYGNIIDLVAEAFDNAWE
ncbi:MAG: beta-lactamase family protein [Bryobacter sp.]|jgi:CubicO group peptidase (beta-lactamase class C family)|nr:beta-lactamase family protein [Bryobacter sp.]